MVLAQKSQPVLLDVAMALGMAYLGQELCAQGSSFEGQFQAILHCQTQEQLAIGLAHAYDQLSGGPFRSKTLSALLEIRANVSSLRVVTAG